MWHLILAILCTLPKLCLFESLHSEQAFAVECEEVARTNAAEWSGHAAVDTGCTLNVAGEGWIDQLQDKLSEFGLRALARPHKEVFKGLGGATRVSTVIYEVPVGICGVNMVMRIAAIEGDMLALLSRSQLSELGCIADLGSDIYQFAALGVWDLKLPQRQWTCDG